MSAHLQRRSAQAEAIAQADRWLTSEGLPSYSEVARLIYRMKPYAAVGSPIEEMIHELERAGLQACTPSRAPKEETVYALKSRDAHQP